MPKREKSADWKAMTTIILLLVVGALLMLLETLLPGLVAGTIGFLCLAGGVALSFHRLGMETGIVVLVCVLVGLMVGALLWIWLLPRSWIGRMFVNDKKLGPSGVERPELVGKEGVALTALRPAGAAQFGKERVDVVTEGELIEPGTPVRVMGVEGLRVVVRAIPGSRSGSENESATTQTKSVL